jgi:hypothetical protein
MFNRVLRLDRVVAPCSGESGSFFLGFIGLVGVGFGCFLEIYASILLYDA